MKKLNQNICLLLAAGVCVASLVFTGCNNPPKTAEAPAQETEQSVAEVPAAPEEQSVEPVGEVTEMAVDAGQDIAQAAEELTEAGTVIAEETTADLHEVASVAKEKAE